jgi:hypothetical protein
MDYPSVHGWESPVSLSHVTSAQIHQAWTEMSEVLWKKDPAQLLLAELLLKEHADNVDLFEIEKVEGVEQLCWGMKKIAHWLHGKMVEITIDATCECIIRLYDRDLKCTDNTNSRNLELYSVLSEYDNASFPISYCLLSTATAIEIGK